MKPNQKNRYNGRYNNRNKRTMILRNTALESSGPSGKLHGTALQLFEKYQSAAKDALIQNDLVLAQTYLQYADHYIRLQNIAIANEQTLAMQSQQNIMNNQMRNNGTENKTGDSLMNDELPIFDAPIEGNGVAAKDVDKDESETKSADSVVEEETACEERKADVCEEPSVQKRRQLTVRVADTKRNAGESLNLQESVAPAEMIELSKSENKTELKSKKTNTLVLRRPGRPRTKSIEKNVAEPTVD